MDSSARSVLLTVLGDVVLPAGGKVWLQAMTVAADALQISPDATRQALRRLATQGLVTASHQGRNARYELTEAGRHRLADAAERIYLRRPLVWDGRWHMLTYTFTERQRASRDALRRELEWLGFGSLGAGVWVCPWDLGVRLQEVLDKHRIAGAVEVFTAIHEGEDRQLAARAYPLADLQAAHAGFVRQVRGNAEVPTDPRAAFVERIRLVHEWRKFLFLDPGLPEELLPDDWLGSDAAATFVARYRKVEPDDWMPDTYRQLNIKFIEMHANSEIMGALPEREWIARAPSLRRKRSLAAKVQDEVGHAHLIYRVAETLGKPRQQMYDDLIAAGASSTTSSTTPPTPGATWPASGSWSTGRRS
jgi:phenylacetic acid degradation operon negative regulatory protein